MTEPVFHNAGEGEHSWGMQACTTVKLWADAAEDRRVSAMEFLCPPDFGAPLHIHHEEDEIIQVLEGRMRVVCGDHETMAEAGTFAYLPRGLPHAFWVLEGPLRMLVLFTPGGAEDAFHNSGIRVEEARLPDPGAVPDGTLGPLLKRHNIEIVGPPLGG